MTKLQELERRFVQLCHLMLAEIFNERPRHKSSGYNNSVEEYIRDLDAINEQLEQLEQLEE